jgi:hypothetical protein
LSSFSVVPSEPATEGSFGEGDLTDMRKCLVVVAVLLAVTGCGEVTPATVSDINEVQRVAQITIPPSATGLQCRFERGIDPLAYGRFEIPTADLSKVLDTIPKDSKIQSYSGYSNVTSHTMSETWWQPGLLREPQVAEGSKPGFSVNLMFGETEQPGIVTVYFFNFGL